MSFAYSGYGPAYRSYSTFSPGRTYTSAYGHHGVTHHGLGHVSSSSFYSPGRTYTTGYHGAPLGTSIVHGGPIAHSGLYGGSIAHSGLYGGSLLHGGLAGPAYTSYGHGLGGTTIVSPGRTYATGYGLGGSHISTSYY